MAHGIKGRLVVVGQGYVGLPLAMRAVEQKWDVVGLDLDATRVKLLARGESYVEDISREQLTQALDSGRYHVRSDYAGASNFDVAIITVPTPLHEGNPDLSYIESSTCSIASHLRPGSTVVLESTTYPGTTEDLVAPLLEEGSGLIAGVDFYLGYSPERIDPGNTKWHFVNTPKVVSGINQESLRVIRGIYDELVDRTVPVSSPKEAELTKLLENTFRHVNIALVNEVAMFAHELDIDVWEAVEAAATKPFGFMPFRPGPGVGGHCLPIDPSYLSWQVKRALGQPFRFVELAKDVNDHMPDYVIRRIVTLLNERKKAVNGSRMLLLGLAYKKNTGDARESPATRVAEMLLQLGAEVRAADPHVVERHAPAGVIRVQVTADEVRRADAVVLLTDHDSFDLDELAAAEMVLDTRNRLPASGSVRRL